jgi:hypothetical protein
MSNIFQWKHFILYQEKRLFKIKIKHRKGSYILDEWQRSIGLKIDHSSVILNFCGYIVH